MPTHTGGLGKREADKLTLPDADSASIVKRNWIFIQIY